MEDLAIGIDLGTTNSCVSLYKNGQVKMLENSDGGRITPSFIFFTSLDEPIVGEHAKGMADMKPANGIYEVKRFVGRQFTDCYIQNIMQYLPFKVERDEKNNEPVIVIEQRNKTLRKTPQELCTIILRQLKSDVEEKLGQTVDKVVITVPAYFNVSQRKVTLAAAKDAGFVVLKLLNEPTAAALSYYFENDCDKTSYSLVYDLGGGTFDVSLLKRSFANIEIVAVDGDTQLGGHDFDNLIVDYVCTVLEKDYKYNPKSNKENLRRLHNKCETAKKTLSKVAETVLTLIGFVPNESCVRITLTREQFETIANDLFARTIKIVDSCIRNSNISKDYIKEIILSGGSTRIPKIQKMISEYFDGKTLNKFVHPDECVAEGAALQAAMLSESAKQSIRKIQMIDVIPLSLGLNNHVNEMGFIIRKNTPIPASGTSSRVNAEDKQSDMSLRIYEGERADVRKNRFLGNLVITDLTPAPPRQCEVTLTLNVDQNGILTATAREKYKENVKELVVEYTRGCQNEQEINTALLDAEQNEEEDKRFRKFARLKSYLLEYCTAIIYNFGEKDLAEAHEAIYEMCKKIKKVAHVMELSDEKKIKSLTKEIKLQCEPHVKYYNFQLMPVLRE